MLGILKAGGAYVPLDPAYPPERLAFMLRDAAVPVLVTTRAVGGRVPSTGARVLCLDADRAQLQRHSARNPAGSPSVQDLAYIIYTSGSTGQPKGVLIPHEGLLNLVWWHRRTFAIEPHDRVSQMAGVAFDACT